MARKILMIIAPDQFRDEELLVPRQAFLQQGWAVDTVSERLGQVKGMLGAVEKIDKDLNYAEAKAKKNGYDAVVVVGGMGSPEYLWDNTQIHHILRLLYKKDRVVSAICLSGAVLANTGLLNGKNATVWEMPESLEVFQQQGVNYTGESVTIDGHFITANGPDAAADFAKAIIDRVNALIPA
jgi:protease I